MFSILSSTVGLHENLVSNLLGLKFLKSQFSENPYIEICTNNRIMLIDSSVVSCQYFIRDRLYFA